MYWNLATLPWTGIYRVTDITVPHAVIANCSTPHANPFRVQLNQIKKYVNIEDSVCTLPTIGEEERSKLRDANAEEQTNLPGSAHMQQPPDQSSAASQAGGSNPWD
ncbi:unnamed protein product [Anisakis simplex]|uniref:Uncharacterized protein n=1 Tax=Anisakis simplex TaxID=6269 RepID=A0A0M3JVW3_ANISI|nr:unnamed protein product [Anisakis simplex]